MVGASAPLMVAAKWSVVCSAHNNALELYGGSGSKGLRVAATSDLLSNPLVGLHALRDAGVAPATATLGKVNLLIVLDHMLHRQTKHHDGLAEPLGGNRQHHCMTQEK